MFQGYGRVDAASDDGYRLPMITAEQIKAARSLLRWKQTDLAERAGTSVLTIKTTESGATDPLSSTMDKIEAAFGQAGVVFLPTDTSGGLGVRFKG